MLPLDIVAGKAERLYLRLRGTSPNHPPLLIVGPPRCGTTLPYLHLAGQFRFSYVPNASKTHWRAPLLGAWWAARRHTYDPVTESRYGHVDQPMGPSDGWNVLNHWFPRFDPDADPHPGYRRALRALARGFEDLLGGPFLNKNNQNSCRIPWLLEAFPDALLVHVHRDLRDAAASLTATRRDLDVPVGEWWSAAPPRHYHRSFSSQVEQSVYTVAGVHQTVDEALADVPEDRWTRLAYEDFCRNPAGLEDWVQDAYRDRGHALGEREPGLDAGYEARSRDWSDEDRRAYEEAVAAYERETGVDPRTLPGGEP